MTEAIRHNYECWSDEPKTIPVPYARLTDTTPTASLPCELTSLLAGTQLTGTIIGVDANNSVAVIDIAAGNTYYQEVRNVLTYAAGVEATWGAINIGDIVYYDNSATMPAGVRLSTSPLDNTGAANTRFGWIVPCNEADMALYPKGTDSASTQECGVCQCGAGL